MSDGPWVHLKSRYPMGALVTGRVKVKFQHGVFLELDENPEARVFVDLLSYNPGGTGGSEGLPAVGEFVTGVVADLVDRDRQLRVRVGPPWRGSE
ncbi:hypothetical protein ACGFSI_24010 [Streptomyces virginiae]|uniref:hypothetical protein n=1 Tax=Streptomyces virginiae TaxID=1961 RepID=UPI00371336D8